MAFVAPVKLNNSSVHSKTVLVHKTVPLILSLYCWQFKNNTVSQQYRYTMSDTPIFVHKGTQPLWFVHTKRYHKTEQNSSEHRTIFKAEMPQLKRERIGWIEHLRQLINALAHTTTRLPHKSTRCTPVTRATWRENIYNTFCAWKRWTTCQPLHVHVYKKNGY